MKKRRERGTGGLIRKKGSKNWYALFWQNGRQRCVATHTPIKQKAQAKLQKLLGLKAIGRLAPVESAKLCYEDLRNALLDDYRTNGLKSLYKPANGKEPYLTSLRHLDKFFTVRKVNTITADEIRRFIKERQAANASNGTINRSLSALKRMFSLAIRDGKLQNAPHIELLKEAPPRQGFLESENFKRLRMELPEHLRAPLTLAYFTGLRLGEIRRLRCDNVDLRASEIRLYGGETKNDEPRTVPLIDELPIMLRMLREKNRHSEYVFGDGSPLGSFRRSWRSACVRAGLGKMQKLDDGTEVYTGLLFHDLRRSGVRNLVRAGVPERVAMAISGHKTRAVFERYNIVSRRDIEEAGQKLSKYFKGQAKVQIENDESLMEVQGTGQMVTGVSR